MGEKKEVLTQTPRDVLLDLADQAINAIEAADPRFSILKAFTYYAGDGYDPASENTHGRRGSDA